jgi:CheY-like chemotaxis protein
MVEKLILYVDDDPDDTELFTEVVKQYHPEFTVKTANNGFEAIKQLFTGKSHGIFPCLIIMDINMPIFNGRDAMQQIKRDNHLKTLPLVMFTTSPKQPDSKLFEENGVEIIQKPANYELLKITVADILTRCVQQDYSTSLESTTDY